MAKKKKHSKKEKSNGGNKKENPLYKRQQQFLESLNVLERNEFFNPKIDGDRRGTLWMNQADLGEELVNRHAWATPSPHALRIIKEFARVGVVEIGCGANAYWANQMLSEGIDVIAYDIAIDDGGKISKQKKMNEKQRSSIVVHKGGPSVLTQHPDRTLFLCYPDEEGEGMGAECLEYYQGMYVIHVGESIMDSNFSMDQAPWGRSSSSDFQERLLSEYHCLIKVELPNWLHVRDSISVWKRSETCTMVFAADSDVEDDEEDEEIEYRHIPCNERLPMNVAAPCCAHLLPVTTPSMKNESQFNPTERDASKNRSISTSSSESQRQKKTKKKKKVPDPQIYSPPGILGIRSRDDHSDAENDSETKPRRPKKSRSRSQSFGSQSIDSLFEDSDTDNPSSIPIKNFGIFVPRW